MAAEVKMDLRLNGLSSGKSSEKLNDSPEGQSNGNHVNGSSDNHHLHNGEFEDGDEEMDGELGQISPSSRRRSTRASAIKAAEKIKLKDEFATDLANQNGIEEGNEEEEEGETSEPLSKKRKLDDGTNLNQFSHRFGIKLEGDEVYMMSDDSEISSLNEQEVDVLKRNYEKIKAREPTEEQKSERLLLLRNAEAELRLEEAKLTMLRKIVKSVHDPNKNQSLMKEKITCQDKAYKPVMATKPGTIPQNLSKPKVPGNANVKNNNPLLTLANLTPAQQQELIRKALQFATADPLQARQVIEALTKGAGGNAASLAAALPQKAASQQQNVSSTPAQTSTNTPSNLTTPQQATTSTLASSSSSSTLNPLAAQTPAQRAAAARQAFRRQADQQLVQLAAPPKAPAHDINFIPNANQQDFCYLLGMDLVVQRVLKDKTADMKVKEIPYSCEECSTDFTPSWKAIGPSENVRRNLVYSDLHLYCEACVHTAQKRKIRQDHTANMKKIFNKFTAQERDFERQIADGKLEAALAEAAKAQAAQQAAQAAASRPTQTATPQPVKPPAQVSSTPASAPKSSTASTSTPTHNATPSSTSSAKNRSSQQNSSQMNPTAQAQLMAMAQMARSNPMLATMMQPMLNQAMNNPAMLTQLMQMQWNPMMIQASFAAQQARLAAQQNSSNMAAMLAQAVQNAQGGSSSSAPTPQQAAAMATLSALANPTSNSSSATTNAMAQFGFPSTLMTPAMMQKFAQLSAATKKK